MPSPTPSLEEQALNHSTLLIPQIGDDDTDDIFLN